MQDLIDNACIISIHAPAKGATRCNFVFCIIIFYFNPRSREGSDLCPLPVNRLFYCISIHAPAKGATSLSSSFSSSLSISIHAPAKGATPWVVSQFAISGVFQSTLPRRERLDRQIRSLIEYISIHAPAKGATLFVAVKVWYPIFQSTLPRRERL